MTKFLMLYCGPDPIDASHGGWPAWLERAGDALVDPGSTMRNGCVVRDGAVAGDAPGPMRGYGILEAEDQDHAIELIRDHPLWQAGSDYTIELFEVPKK